MKVVRLAMVITLMVCLATGVFGQTSGCNNELEAVNQDLSCNTGAGSGWFSRPYSRHYIVDYSDHGQQYFPAPKYSIIGDGLTIFNVTRDDSKTYICQARQTNTGDVIEKGVELRVRREYQVLPGQVPSFILYSRTK